MLKSALQKPELAKSLVDTRFGQENGVLTIGGHRVDALAEQYGTPFYAYDAEILRDRYHELQRALGTFADVYFSIKANPRPAVAEVLVGCGAGLEVASGAEFAAAVKTGCSPQRIIFAGPGKGEAELRSAIEGGLGELHLESFEEIEMAAAVARAAGRIQKVSIRVNPVAVAQGGAMRMGGKPAAFGFDEEMLADVAAAILPRPELDLAGIHMFAGTQILQAEVLLEQWAHALEVASRLADEMPRPIRSIDLGGGLGIPYHEGDSALDLVRVAEGIPALKKRLAGDPRISGAHVIVEPGRFLAGPAGIYVMAVRSVKQSRGSRFIVTDGGMHHHLAASGNLGQVIKKDYPLVAASQLNAPSQEQAFVVGPLCTPLDTLGRQTSMPEMVAGDLVAVLQSGAYGLTASPTGFLSHPAPAELLIDGGKVSDLRE